MRGTCVQNWCHKLSYRLWLMVVLWGAITKRRPTAQSQPQHISWHSKLLLALEGFPDSSNSLVLFTLRLAKNRHLCKLFIYSLIGGKLLYNVVVVAAAQQLNSAIIAHISSLLGRPPTPHPAPADHRRVPVWAPCVTHSVSPALCSMHCCVYVSVFLLLVGSFLTLLYPQSRSLSASPSLPCRWVHHTIFLGSIYMRY